ncbi:hypothetical protein CEXT_191811 [Caerostris extrusa]|uniref:Uncharacterized protein n=1 Tax=Caerostris extrusa TaxID=172846 RepID=A0AAV4TDC9_CAEEX|nr:hypothetical protein CEXT_191811 [Caerostris extrusa]
MVLRNVHHRRVFNFFTAHSVALGIPQNNLTVTTKASYILLIVSLKFWNQRAMESRMYETSKESKPFHFSGELSAASEDCCDVRDN